MAKEFFYENRIFLTVLFTISVFCALYLLGCLAPLGLRYEPNPIKYNNDKSVLSK